MSFFKRWRNTQYVTVRDNNDTFTIFYLQNAHRIFREDGTLVATAMQQGYIQGPKL